MKVNQVIHNFRIDEIKVCDFIGATLYQFVHEKTKAKLLWFDRDDDNKTFIIGFNTIPTDSTGVFHIIEHSVLNGSKKYPVKEPFVDLLKGSLQTYLNALTFPDKTLYPISSRNTKDFYNLMRVYLDGVFAPNCIDNPLIFSQEGWRYKIDDVRQPIEYKGVVYSEMQGAFASVERMISTALQNNLFPDNCYGYISGGDPDHITDLTYQKFVDTYHQYYNPTNSYIFLDGSIDIDEALRIIDEEYLANYNIGPSNYRVDLQKAIGNKNVQLEYPISSDQDDKDKVYMDIGYVISDYQDKQTNLAFSILASVLTSNNQSVLAKEIISNSLAEDVDFIMNDDLKQSYAEIYLVNVKDDKIEDVKTIIDNTLRELVRTGIDKEELTAALNKMMFVLREKDFGSKPKGLIYGLSAMTDWMRGSNPTSSLDLEDDFALLRQKIQTNYFEDLINRYLLHSNHSCCVIMRPNKNLKQQKQQQEIKKLYDYKNSLSAKQLLDLLEFNDQFNSFQRKTDSKEDKDKLPVLTLKDINEKPVDIKNKIYRIDGVTTIEYQNNTDGIDYVNMYFDISDLTDRQLPLLSIIIDLIDQCPTKNHDLNQITRNKKMYLGNFDISPMYNHDYQKDIYNIQLNVSFSCLSANRDKALEIVNEVLYESIFEDKQLILDTLKQSLIDIKELINNSGVKIATLRSHACYNELYAAKERIEGLDYYYYLKDFISDLNDTKLKEIRELFKQLFTKNRLTVSVMGDNRVELANKVVARCKEDDCIIGHVYHDLFKKENTAILTTSDVSFAIKSSNLYQETRDIRGEITVTNKIISLDYLWNEVRAKNGAYGTGINSTLGIFTFYSYRDPNALKSLKIYQDTVEYLKGFVVSKQPLTNYIIGTIGDLDPLLTNVTQMRLGDSNYFKNTRYEDRCKFRNQVLNFNHKKLEKLVDLYQKASQDSVNCVVGNLKTIEKLDGYKIYKL